jgi:hypothetical protein
MNGDGSNSSARSSPFDKLRTRTDGLAPKKNFLILSLSKDEGRSIGRLSENGTIDIGCVP